MRLWLTRRPDGSYVLTRLAPVITRRLGSQEQDVYEAPGEPIGVRHLCAEGMQALRRGAPHLEVCVPRRVLFTLTDEEETQMAGYRVQVGGMKVTKITDDGVEVAFFEAPPLEYSNMPKEYVEQVQQELVTAQQNLLNISKQETAGGSKRK